MKKILLAGLILVVMGTALSFAAEKSPYYNEFQQIIDGKCSKCHTRTRIDQAMAEHRDMMKIQERMIQHGAQLNAHEKQVLGIFFRDYQTKENETAKPESDPLAEYRSVVKARCSGCHSLDLVEAAMRQKRDFASLAQMMIKRGAVLDDKDMKIIQTFWGKPLR